MPKYKELPLYYKLQNVWLKSAAPFYLSAELQWRRNTARRAKRAGQRPAQMAVLSYCTGESTADIRERLARFGIPSANNGVQFELWPDKEGIGIHNSFLVPGPQAQMATDILYQYAGHYEVQKALTPSGAQYNNPWGVSVPPRSWLESLERALLPATIPGQRRTAVKRKVGKPRKRPKQPVTARSIAARAIREVLR